VGRDEKRRAIAGSFSHRHDVSLEVDLGVLTQGFSIAGLKK
jgi:hypothetical protein